MGIVPQPHQEEWIQACQEIGDDPWSGKKFIIIAPPGSGKTTLVGIGFTAWMIGKYPSYHTGLISYANTIAHKRSLAVRNLIERSKPYHFTFPDIQPDLTNWSKEAFTVQRADVGDPHATLIAGGAKSAVVGNRLEGLMVDDPMDQKNSANANQRQKTNTNFEEAIETRVIEHSWQLIIGTRWADDDFIGNLMKREKGGYTIMHLKALDDHDQSYWPERYSNEYLTDFRYNKPATFYVQYQGDTTGGKAGIIKRVSAYEMMPAILRKEKDLLIGIGVDTALKDGEKNDFTAFAVGGLDKNGRVWVLDIVQDHMDLTDITDTAKELYHEYKPYNIWFEDTAQGTPAVKQLIRDMPEIPCEAVPYSQGGKYSRAHALAPKLHGGVLVLYRFAEWFEDVKHTLTHWPQVAHDDDLDALFILWDHLSQVMHPAFYSTSREAKINLR